MSRYEKGMQLINERFGNKKDNVISLATIATSTGSSGLAQPKVRDVDAMYEDGKLYIVTMANSNKVIEIENNPEVSVSVNFEDFFANGKGKNLGWVLKPENSLVREKLKETFKEWYEPTNNEEDPNCCFLEITLERGTLRLDNGREFYHIDFLNKETY